MYRLWGETQKMDESRGHQIKRFQSKRPDQHPNKCLPHSGKRCDQFCKQCQFPVCSECIVLGSHSNHNIVILKQILEFRKKKAARDQRLLKSFILPSYQTISQKIQNELDYVEKNNEEVVRAIERHGELKHSEIERTVNKLKVEAGVIRSKQTKILQEQILAIRDEISSIEEEIDNSQKVLNSQSLIVVSSYASKCPGFKMLPQIVNVQVPQFKCRVMPQTEQEAMFGNLSMDNVQTEVVYTEMPAALYSCPLKELIEEPEMVMKINSWFSHRLYSVACLGKDMVFTTGNNCTIEKIKLTMIGGICIQLNRTVSRNRPWDITPNKDGHLVYTNRENKL